jgi:hypothetical protein
MSYNVLPIHERPQAVALQGQGAQRRSVARADKRRGFRLTDQLRITNSSAETVGGGRMGKMWGNGAGHSSA